MAGGSLVVFVNANPHFRLFLPDGSPGVRYYRGKNLAEMQSLQAEAKGVLDGAPLADDFWERVEAVPFEVR